MAVNKRIVALLFYFLGILRIFTVFAIISEFLLCLVFMTLIHVVQCCAISEGIYQKLSSALVMRALYKNFFCACT